MVAAYYLGFAGWTGPRNVENKKTGRESLEARDDREECCSVDAFRWASAEYQARNGILASDTYGKGAPSTSLDSVAGYKTCRQVSEGARALWRNVEATCSLFKSSRTGQVGREQEQSDHSNEGPLSLNVRSGDGCLGLGERQSGSSRQRVKSLEQFAGTESITPLASNLRDQSCHAPAAAGGQPTTDWAGGECPEPESATVSRLAGGLLRPCNGRWRPHDAFGMENRIADPG